MDGTGARERGWGLGLWLVKGTAEAHGGGVSVTSTQEEGTTFGVTFLRDARQPAACEG